MGKWIKCSESLPKNGQVVILSGYYWADHTGPRFVEPSVFADGEFHPIAYDEGADYEPIADEEATMKGTHWMPMPEEPED
ncbi:hypothetical protein PSm6_00340 [Pseudomonas solani]|uniref:DUF551 domain-containing protein n=1 Tax=Pseudomonas solani TaxID=2731552 RepID=A0ABM7L286_9PSED|nr:DUF551 domain-containing protein [Pseudomonas solani]BCD83627.1 hypothetical protein PSm6_00340 [Pseudomonas solani]